MYGHTIMFKSHNYRILNFLDVQVFACLQVGVGKEDDLYHGEVLQALPATEDKCESEKHHYKKKRQT